MKGLRVVIRVGVLWIASVGAAIAGMEVAHRIVVAAEHTGGRSATHEEPSASTPVATSSLRAY